MKMRKKQFICMIIFICAIASATSCQNRNTDSSGEKVNQSINKAEQKEDGNENKVNTKQENTAEIRLELNESSLEYQLDTDFQPFFQWSQAAKSENGYYFWGEGNDMNMIMFCDNTSGMTVPLCSLPNCKHGADGEYEQCNAYFGASNGNDQIHYQLDYMQYYKGNLYLLGYGTDGYVNIYKVASDGSTREKCCTLYKTDFIDPLDPENADTSLWSAPSICIHRGYVYFIDNSESEPKIRRVDIDGKEEAQVIYETSGVRPSLYRMEGYGDYIFFQTGNFTDESYEDIEGGIYTYQIKNGEIALVKNDAISSYIIRNGAIYYSTDTGVKRYDLSSQKDEEFVETVGAYADVMADENYIYIHNQSDEAVIVYDENRNKIEEIVLENYGQYLYGDEKYFFATWAKGTESSGVKRLDKSLLKDGIIQWEALP